MLKRGSDAQWERIGREDPYYGVLSRRRFRRTRLSDEALTEFFRSGEDHVAFVLQTVRRALAPGFAPARILDFGCGVGRCTIPLAAAGRHVVAADVSAAMLEEAAANCARRGIANVELVPADDRLSRVSGRFDLVHSALVLQHVAPRRGERIFARLLELLAAGGVGVVQVPYDRQVPALLRVLGGLRGRLPPAHALANALLRKPLRDPHMEKHAYDVNRLLGLLRAGGCDAAHVLLHGGAPLRSVLLFFRKVTIAVPHDAVGKG